jgi:hypothetical protein
MARKKLILVASDRMDDNKKESRNEHGLVRMSAAVRKNMKFDQDSVEIYPANTSATNRIAKTQMLKIFQAFAVDIKSLKTMISSGDLTPEEAVRVGFVTTKTLNKVNGTRNRRKSNDIWISDTISDTVIGSDPEFLLFNRSDGHIVRANSIMSKTGKMGSDGAMAEIRPDPAISPADHVSNMVKIFKNDQAAKLIKDYKWSAECYHRDNNRDYSVGGHIHIGNPIRIANMPQNDREAFFRCLNKVMDELLAVPLIKLDGADKGSRRRTNCQVNSGGGGFGYFGEYRLCGGRLEHRTLSGMWLLHPSVARAVFGTAKAIIDEVFRLVSDKKFNKKYMCLYPDGSGNSRHMWKRGYDGWKKMGLLKDMRCVTSTDDMIGILHKSSSSTINITYLKSWLSKMKGFSTYRENAKYIQGLYDILKISATNLQGYDREIQKNWLGKKKFLVEV